MQVQLFLEEMFSVVLTPYILYFVMPPCVADIVDFVAHNTVEVEGVGAVCSLAVFDLTRHGNTKYGSSPGGASSKQCRSRQGKVEKSLLTFIATYPTWEPPVGASALLTNMDRYRYFFLNTGRQLRYLKCSKLSLPVYQSNGHDGFCITLVCTSAICAHISY